MHRPTRDADLLGFGSPDQVIVEKAFKEICSESAPEDGLNFDLDSIAVEAIRETDEYDGLRVRVKANLDGAQVTVQVDIGYGDVVTPAIERIDLPSYLGLPPAALRAYPKETVIAEKTEAMVKFGIANSRMKDFFDNKWLSDHYQFDGKVLSQAIKATFERRNTQLPNETPVALSSDCFADTAKRTQWNAFARKLNPPSTDTFHDVGERVIAFLLPPLLAARTTSFNQKWVIEKGWSDLDG